MALTKRGTYGYSGQEKDLNARYDVGMWLCRYDGDECDAGLC